MYIEAVMVVALPRREESVLGANEYWVPVIGTDFRALVTMSCEINCT